MAGGRAERDLRLGRGEELLPPLLHGRRRLRVLRRGPRAQRHHRERSEKFYLRIKLQRTDALGVSKDQFEFRTTLTLND